MKYYTYVLKSSQDVRFYTGYTKDLKNRLAEHNSCKVKSTSHRAPFKLVYYEMCLNKQDAIAREKYLKSGFGKKYIKNRIRNYLHQ